LVVEPEMLRELCIRLSILSMTAQAREEPQDLILVSALFGLITLHPPSKLLENKTNLQIFNWGDIQLKQQLRIMVAYRSNPVQIWFVDGLGYDHKGSV
jgi:hypothetical protein